ncbi:MAG: type II secretion system protein [Oscillospiraceae bacterium]|nr:type II secretion system protein [Oscillospiraceae bacterium]
MKKTLKAFTLIELIIVMAIMTILMAAIMQMMKPIRATYVDSTLYESQRTTQTGIVKYISESLRYATDVGIYTQGASNNEYDVSKRVTTSHSFSSTADAEDAVLKFKAKTGITDDKLIRVITIDNKNDYTYGGKKFNGRLLISRPVTSSTGSTTSTNIKNADVIGTGEGYARLALGSAYYGLHSFSINVMPDGEMKELNVNLPYVPAVTSTDPVTGVVTIVTPAKSAYTVNDYVFTANNNLKIVVSSVTESAIDKTGNTVEKANIDNKDAVGNRHLTYVATDGYVDCLNAGIGGGVLDVNCVKMTGTGANKKPAGTSTNGEMTYIVYAVSPF